jgi:hypothetical protein
MAVHVTTLESQEQALCWSWIAPELRYAWRLPLDFVLELRSTHALPWGRLIERVSGTAFSRLGGCVSTWA